MAFAVRLVNIRTQISVSVGVVCFANFAGQASLAQIEVTTDNGETVRLGPGSVSIQTRYGKTVEAKNSMNPAGQERGAKPRLPVRQKSGAQTSGALNSGIQKSGVQIRVDGKAKKVPSGSSELPAKVKALMMLSGAKMEASKKPLPSVIEVSADDIILYDNNVNQTLTCTNNGVVVQGNHCSLSVVGNCKVLSVSGNFNTVRCENVGAISVPGNHNTIFWLKGLNGQKNPIVSVSGNSNSCSKAR